MTVVPFTKGTQRTSVRRGNRAVWFKSCPHCHNGDMMLQRDTYGWFRECIQCGFMQELRTATKQATVATQEAQTETSAAFAAA